MLQRNLLIGAAALLLAAAVPATAEEVAVTACDWEAAHPSDPNRVGPGVGSRDVDTERAIRACEAAVGAHPEVARFHYQLGRALARDREERYPDARSMSGDLAQALRVSNVNFPGGRIRKGPLYLPLRILGEFEILDEIRVMTGALAAAVVGEASEHAPGAPFLHFAS